MMQLLNIQFQGVKSTRLVSQSSIVGVSLLFVASNHRHCLCIAYYGLNEMMVGESD